MIVPQKESDDRLSKKATEALEIVLSETDVEARSNLANLVSAACSRVCVAKRKYHPRVDDWRAIDRKTMISARRAAVGSQIQASIVLDCPPYYVSLFETKSDKFPKVHLDKFLEMYREWIYGLSNV